MVDWDSYDFVALFEAVEPLRDKVPKEIRTSYVRVLELMFNQNDEFTKNMDILIDYISKN